MNALSKMEFEDHFLHWKAGKTYPIMFVPKQERVSDYEYSLWYLMMAMQASPITGKESVIWSKRFRSNMKSRTMVRRLKRIS